MKKSLIVLTGLAITVLISCNGNKTESEETIAPVDSIVVKTDSATLKEVGHFFWTSDFVANQGLVMKKTTPIASDSLSSVNMIERLNSMYPEVKIDFIKQSNDSIFLQIKKSTYLTQQMGSSGAEAYLGELTYNLTEVTGINYVNLRFKEGDHAAPGTYSRTDFIQVREP